MGLAYALSTRIPVLAMLPTVICFSRGTHGGARGASNGANVQVRVFLRVDKGIVGVQKPCVNQLTR